MQGMCCCSFDDLDCGDTSYFFVPSFCSYLWDMGLFPPVVCVIFL